MSVASPAAATGSGTVQAEVATPKTGRRRTWIAAGAVVLLLLGRLHLARGERTTLH